MKELLHSLKTINGSSTQPNKCSKASLCISPLGRFPDSNNETRVRTSALATYTKAIKQLADKNNGVFADLSRTAKDEDLRKDPIHSMMLVSKLR